MSASNAEPRTAVEVERPALLLVDDDPVIVETLGYLLEPTFEVIAAGTRREAMEAVASRATPPTLALVDLGLPPDPHEPAEGYALIGELQALSAGTRILVLTGQNEAAVARHALALGAVDFVAKPCDADALCARLRHQQLICEAERPLAGPAAAAERLIGASPAVETLRALIDRFAGTAFPVLIEGESGSGKELVAAALHAASGRRDAPFVTVNCAAFTASLLEAQLFGHARGAFTGATTARRGFFEEAGAGSLFLDEVGEIPAELQAKLLRVLENGEYYRVGETAPRSSTARIIAATNRSLRDEVARGVFREDLFHRLGVLTLRVPPLRERGNDCLLLFDWFRDLYRDRLPPFTLDGEARARLARHAFPGNVRELRNVVVRLGAKYPGAVVGAGALEAELDGVPGEATGAVPAGIDEAVQRELGTPGFVLDERLAAIERRYVDAALAMSDGSLTRAARLLGINRTTLYSRIERLDRH